MDHPVISGLTLLGPVTVCVILLAKGRAWLSWLAETESCAPAESARHTKGGQARRARIAALVIVALAALATIPCLGSTTFYDRDEGYYAECAREMAASGDYTVPRVDGEYFFDKPPLCYWLQVGSMRLFGVNSLGARLPSAVIGLLMVGWTVFLGGRLFGKNAGTYAGFALATSIIYVVIARMAIMDQAFSFAISLALGTFLLTYLKMIPRWGYVGFWAAMGAASLIKGPAGAALVLLTAGAFLILRKDWRGIGRAMPVLGIIAFVAIALPWYVIVHKQTGGAFTTEFLVHQNLARAVGKDFHHNGSVFLYIPLFALGLYLLRRLGHRPAAATAG